MPSWTEQIERERGGEVVACGRVAGHNEFLEPPPTLTCSASGSELAQTSTSTESCTEE